VRTSMAKARRRCGRRQVRTRPGRGQAGIRMWPWAHLGARRAVGVTGRTANHGRDRAHASRGRDRGGRRGQVTTRPDAGERRARAGTRGAVLGAVEAVSAADFVFVNDGVRVPARDTGVVGQPVHALVTAKERGTRFKAAEPLSEVAASDDRDSGNEACVHAR
jgi:hypothetical protein